MQWRWEVGHGMLMGLVGDRWTEWVHEEGDARPRESMKTSEEDQVAQNLVEEATSGQVAVVAASQDVSEGRRMIQEAEQGPSLVLHSAEASSCSDSSAAAVQAFRLQEPVDFHDDPIHSQDSVTPGQSQDPSDLHLEQ